MKRNLLLLAASIALAVVVFELAVRLSPFDRLVDHNWRFHPRYGWTQIPDAGYDYDVGGRRVTLQYNSRGFRDDERQLEKPSGVRRVVVIGDSFSEAVQVNIGETWHQRLQEALNAAGGDRWEVLNFGIGDFGTLQELLVLEHVALGYNPDVVIHQIFPLNDPCNNNVELAGLCKSINDPYRPYASFDDGRMSVVHTQPVRHWLRGNVATWFLLERGLVYRSMGGREQPDWPARFRQAGFEGLDPLLLTYVPTENRTQYPAIEQGWLTTEALIERTVATTREAGARYLALVVPFEARLGSNWASFQSSHAAGTRMDVDYPERRLAALFERLGVEYVMARPALERELDEVLPFIDGHLNPSGHRVVSEAVLEQLR